ncbi:putative metal-binding motif-containing protein [Myxococcota bacterium]|nr:putative metal-binding motif-containing protein [Myxococcota bacterium]
MPLPFPRAGALRPSRQSGDPWWPAILVAATVLANAPDARAGGDCTGEPTRVALFQDLAPWSVASNEEVFGDAGISFTVFTSLQMGVVSLTTYDKVVIPSDQPPDFYSELESYAWWFEAWLDGGCCRVLEVHGADEGWNGGVWDAMGPAGLSTGGEDTNDVTVVTAGHRFLTTPYSITSSSLDGVGSSAHGTIQTTLPGETIVVKDAASNFPVLIEFPYGDGWVIASTLTLEFAYESGEHMVLPNLVSAMRPATDGCSAPDPDDDGDGWTVGEGDCDDSDPDAFPGASQVCDGVLDNNCDGVTDAFESDGDSDGWTECEGDCDDTRANSNPAAEEVCTGGRDEDCDGYVDGDDWDCDEPSDDDTADDDTADDDVSDDDTSDDDVSDDDASDDDVSDDDASDDDVSDDDASDDDTSDDDMSDDDASDDDSWLSGDDDDDDDDGSDRTRRGACTGCSSQGAGVGAVGAWALLALAPWRRVRRRRV